MLPDWSDDVKEVPHHLPSLLRKFVHFFGQRETVIQYSLFLCPIQVRSVSWDYKKVVFLVDPMSSEPSHIERLTPRLACTIAQAGGGGCR